MVLFLQLYVVCSGCIVLTLVLWSSLQQVLRRNGLVVAGTLLAVGLGAILAGGMTAAYYAQGGS